MKKILLVLFAAMVAMAATAAKDHRYTLVIDAGHGGKDPGTMTRTAKEKNIALNVALAFGRYVERNCPDVRVIYTRKTDVFVPLTERAAIANRNKADVFISIHVNSVASKKLISGLETYTMGMRRSDEKLSAAQRENEVITLEDNYKQRYAGYDPRSPESTIIFEFMNEQNMVKSVELARLIQQRVSAAAGRPNKGVKQDAFLVLRETSMPACLVELGYITTPSEEAIMTSKSKVEQMGLGLYQAFVAYKNKQTGSKTVVITEPEPARQAPAREEPRQKPDTARAEKPRTQPKEEPRQQPREDTTEAEVPAKEAAASDEAPVFKVQILTSDQQLKAGDRRLKGHTGVESYREGRIWKYTLGSSTDYNEIYRLRKQLVADFPQAFIIAFQGGEKTDVSAAIQAFKKNKK